MELEHAQSLLSEVGPGTNPSSCSRIELYNSFAFLVKFIANYCILFDAVIL